MKTTTIIFTTFFLCCAAAAAQSGVYLDASSAMHNSIVYGNTDTASVGKQIAGAGNVTYSAIENFTGAFGNLSLTESPFAGKNAVYFDKYAVIQGITINAGSNAALTEIGKDAAGFARVWQNAVDMGAYEYQFPRNVHVSAVDTSKVQNAADPELTYTLSGDALLAGDDLDVKLVRASGEEINTYIIDTLGIKILRTAAGLDVTALYAVGFTTGTFTVKTGELSLEISNTLPLTVYPTITNGILHFGGIEREANVAVYDLSGKQLISKVLRDNNNTLDISNLKAGTFVVKISENKNTETQKVIKK
ncbi:MAG: T9SS type A sorting domain-containing protein [Paludibacter sp.]|jgi:hypothetical protein|nr:T9SS type A sorting domain-containing protein [Paludibacter sp.]